MMEKIGRKKTKKHSLSNRYYYKLVLSLTGIVGVCNLLTEVLLWVRYYLCVVKLFVEMRIRNNSLLMFNLIVHYVLVVVKMVQLRCGILLSVRNYIHLIPVVLFMLCR